MKKKILFVINTLGYGGAERAMLDLFDIRYEEKNEETENDEQEKKEQEKKEES